MTTLAWTLLHFLWQGSAIAAAAALVLRSSRSTAQMRYAWGVGALALMAVAPVVTFVALTQTATDDVVAGASRAVMGVAGPLSAPSVTGTGVVPLVQAAYAAPFLFCVVASWAVGVALLAVRLFGGWMLARGLTRRVAGTCPVEVEALAREVCAHLKVRRVIAIHESAATVAPVVIGWIRPVVLLPAAALAGLAPVQLEALLAHELAHVRRHDYLVNLGQTILETALFYHPAVWWVSRRVRIEREHCCDDLAVSVCDRVEYVNAISALAALPSARSLALAASDGSLVSRVRRLLGPSEMSPGGRLPWLSLASAVVLLAIPAVMLARTVPGNLRDDRSRFLHREPADVSTASSSLPERLTSTIALPSLRRSRVLPARAAGSTQAEPTPEAPPQQDAVDAGERGALAAALQNARDQLVQMAFEQRALAVAQTRTRAEAERADVRQRVEALRTQLSRLQTLYERGLASEPTVRALERDLSALVQRLSTLESAGPMSPEAQALETRKLGLEELSQQLASLAVAQRTAAANAQLPSQPASAVDGITVVGAVMATGVYTYRPGITVQEALALSGGAREGAVTSGIRVVHPTPEVTVLSAKLSDLVQPGDILVVPWAKP